MKTPTAVCTLAAGAVLAALAAGCSSGSSTPSSMTVHGRAKVCQGGADNTGLTAGSQVAVVSPAGTVVGNSSLVEEANPPASDTAALIGDYTFTLTVPGGQPRYGVEVGAGAPPVWFSAAEMKSGPVVAVSGDGSCGI